ncbi:MULTISPECIES: DUF4142 domain-containing protein [unclassified Pseudonocardia]|uniref:DUF4142 domain-containing protein n=1 Tax=unclassified Pseudonocardia TaxID=2619320 RepID=UPI0001FFEFFD|nr:DUF4142 domain-containing protein [Pseudonocardia sp. Ae707_Ps1]OLM15966.1 putative secreted protein [Pseudonocardia sp. Ae707_Ps1]
MSRRIPGPLRWSIVAALAAVVAVALAQSWASVPAAAGTGWTQTQWGPLGPADRDLLEKVRLAGLWEAPTGEQAQQQASSDAVRDVGQKVAVEHHALDEIVRDTAGRLGVPLPSRPSDQQIGWMNDLTGRSGADYDRQFVQILRSAHGTILPAIAQVRSGTRNEMVRQFAAEADAYVTRHIGYLEATGMVDYAALPAPPDPVSTRSMSALVVPAIVVGVALLAAGGLLMTLYRRGRSGGGAATSGLLPAGGLIPRPRRARDDAAGPPPRRAALPVGPPDPWDELAHVPPARPRPDGGAGSLDTDPSLRERDGPGSTGAFGPAVLDTDLFTPDRRHAGPDTTDPDHPDAGPPGLPPDGPGTASHRHTTHRAGPRRARNVPRSRHR